MRQEPEQRLNYRSRDRRKAVLRVGWWGRYVLDLIEVSAWGFTLSSPHPLPLKRNVAYRLRTSAGWSRVCLVHSQAETGWHRYGLMRIEDLPDLRANDRVLNPGKGERLRYKAPRERIASVGYFVVLLFALAVFAYYRWN